jgi:2-(1,2-epoxy-1,2-dihydrophenyl)acetyl-CoA isomerase
MASGANDLSTQLDMERDSQRQAGQSRDFIEGVMAFREKRLPRFQGE